MIEPKYHFDRSTPFYPIVMAYLLQLHGIKEISALGAIGSARRWDFQSLAGSEEDQVVLQNQIAKLLGPLSLSITGESARLEIPIEDVAREFLENHNYLIEHQVRAALSALVLAHEITKGQPYRVPSEKWEFLRHCRNAAAHNGCWHFNNGEPSRPANWRGIQLVQSMHGQPILKQPNGTGFLGLGDPIALLWEIETENPSMCL